MTPIYQIVRCKTEAAETWDEASKGLGLSPANSPSDPAEAFSAEIALPQARPSHIVAARKRCDGENNRRRR
jgi:hypothetical protein